MGTVFNNVKDLAYGELAEAITADQTSFDLATGDGARFDVAPFIATIGQPGLDGAYGAGYEKILVGARTGETFSSITRSYGGTTAPPGGWPAETPVRLNWVSEYYDAITTLLALVEWFVQQIAGGADGIYCYPGILFDSFKVVETTPATMAVKVREGALFEDGIPYRLAADTTTDLMAAPVTNPRIDRIYFNTVTGAVAIATGTEAGEPVPPDLPAGGVKLARVYHTVDETEIENADITNERVLINA